MGMEEPAVSSIVALDELAETLARYRFAYVLTVGQDAQAHVISAYATVSGDSLVITDLGRRTKTNIEVRPTVTLVWPPSDPADYSLIVDGTGTLDGEQLAVRPTRAVLHRPAPPIERSEQTAEPPGTSLCGSDCVPIPLTEPVAAGELPAE